MKGDAIMGHIEITKKVCLNSWANSTCSGAYYLIHGRIYNEQKTAFYRFKFVLLLDFALDTWDAENERDIPVKDALDDMAWAFIPDAVDLFEDDARRIAFIRECNVTIDKYNERNRRGRAFCFC